ncbi:MAG: FliM/FliN family flagellar motor switch protein [Fibrobacteria bacterium]|nr:FliM/FliN family flagellar motor switch protein [Fibrobacteria bacterium]
MTQNIKYTASNRKKLDIENLQDIKLPIRLILGDSKLKIRELLELKTGKVVELGRLAGETVDFVVNNKVIAKGEVVIIDDNFGVRLVTLLTPEERLKLM